MIEFTDFKIEEGIPVYLQIIYYLKRQIASGLIRDGDELPSRRMLSALLGINPNTVQKAFKVLEDEGVVISSMGAKSLIKVTEEKRAELKREIVEEHIGYIVRSVRQMGLSLEDTKRLIEKYWGNV